MSGEFCKEEVKVEKRMDICSLLELIKKEFFVIEDKFVFIFVIFWNICNII